MGIKLKQQDIVELKATNDYYVIGRLAVEDEVIYPVEEGLDGRVRYSIMPLCEEARCIEDANAILPGEGKFIGFDSKLRLPLEYKYSSPSEKIEIVTNIVKDKLLIFKTNLMIKEELSKRTSGDYKDYLIFKNPEGLEIIKDYKPAKKYVRVPKVNFRAKDFIGKIRNNEYIELKEYPNTLEPPTHMICNNYIYYFGANAWEMHESKKYMWSYCGDVNKILVWECSEVEEVIDCSSYTKFIEEDLFANESGKRIESIIDIIEEEIMEEHSDDSESNEKEEEFLLGLKELCLHKGLAYEYQDLINLHISIKTNIITIISGMTGTGKSQLAWAYSKMLDASLENQNLLFVPISPAYMEPADIIGYYNSQIGMFTPAETGLIDFLVRAEKDQNKPYIIIFDEMNLSQVEQWFAPFLSLLEVDPEDRYLPIYSKNNRCLNDEKYPYRIKIGDNIRIIGTINLDETVKEFSDRLLDRTNMIQLRKRRFVDLIDEVDYENHATYQSHMCSSMEDYNGWIKHNKIQDIFSMHELEFFDGLHELIASTDVKKGISFRVLNSICDYMGNIPKDAQGNDLIDKGEALDIQIKQRIISKIKGSKKIVGDLLGNYSKEEGTLKDSKLIEFLDREESREISAFKGTRELILQKAKELNLYGYTY